jgi:hypothetical protein
MKRQMQLGIINLLAAGMLLTSAGTPVLAAESPPADTLNISTASDITNFENSDTPGPVTRDQRRGPSISPPSPPKPGGGSKGPDIAPPTGGGNRGPGQTGGVGLGGPGGAGPGGPALSTGPGKPGGPDLGSAGIGGRGGGGGLSNIGPGGTPRPGSAGSINLGGVKPGAGVGVGLGSGGIGVGNGADAPSRPSLGQIGIGGGIGIGNAGPTGEGPLGTRPGLNLPGLTGIGGGQADETGSGLGIRPGGIRPGQSDETGSGLGRPGGIRPGQGSEGGLGSGLGLGDGQTGIIDTEDGLVIGQLDGPFVFGEGNYELPPVPTVLDNLEPGATAQQAIETVIEQGPVAAEAAIEAAVNAYEVLWGDYYDAVDYAADAYYDAVTGVIDYGLDSFEDYYGLVVAESLAAIDDYYDYYDVYLDYIAMYPWDSYAYMYDEAAEAYVSQEPVNVYYYNYYYDAETVASEAVPVSTEQTVTTYTAPIPAQAPAPSAEAYEALVVFANDQLGAIVDPLYAGEVTEEVLNALMTLPAQAQYPAYLATKMDIAGYYGLLKGGAAALAVGECPTGQVCQLGTDIPAELSQAALGVYAIRTGEPVPTTPAEALQLAQLVYPKLTGLEFIQLADVQGYAFMAQTASIATVDGQPATVAKVVLTGVGNYNGQTVVYAAVGVGDMYANLLNPFVP